jgi:parallel beta-helix repeat protein
VPEKPTSVGRTSATLNARIHTTFGGAVTYWFRFGETRAYGRETPHRTVQLAKDTGRAVSESWLTVMNLTPGTQYHWQVCAQDTEEQPPRTNCSADRTFFTANVSCGQTITQDTTLTADLEGCENPLRIGADDITVDLGGHTLDGGISNRGFDGVTIRNGTLKIANTPSPPSTLLGLADARDNLVTGLNVFGLEGGISLSGDLTGTVVENNSATAPGIALAVYLGAHGALIRGNDVSGAGSASPDRIAPFVVVGDDNVVEGNTVKLSGEGFGRGVAEASLSVRGDRNQLLRNIVSDGQLDGILVEGEADGTVLIGNTASHNGYEFSFGSGIVVQGTNASLQDNVANDNVDFGIVARTGSTDLGGNRASGNGEPAQCIGVVCQ